MMPPSRRWLPCCLVALVVGLFHPAVKEVCAQGDEASPAPGPSRASLNASAASLATDPPPSPIWIQGRFDAFQDDFSSDFGVAAMIDPGAPLETFGDRMTARWGDERWFEWVRRGLALYARFQSWTETERRGFDMEVEMDDLPEGKVGVRVNRALE